MNELGSRAVPSKIVVKTLQLLQVLSEDSVLGVTELAKRSSMNKSTVCRFMNTLCDLGYARKDSDDRYTLTLKLFELGTKIMQSKAFWMHVREPMSALAQQTKETIHLVTLENLRMVYIHKIDSTESLRVTIMSRVDQMTPFHCTALGKVMLAYADQSVRDAIIKMNPLTRFTDRTITTEAQLMTELEQVRIKGVAIDNEEQEIGIRCVAVPVLQSNIHTPLAALSISAPAVRLSDTKLLQYGELLKQTAASIAERLGLAQ